MAKYPQKLTIGWVGEYVGNTGPLIPIPKDEYFIVTSGEYSSYLVVGLFRARETLDIRALQKEYLREYPASDSPNWGGISFLSWLVTEKGLAEEFRFYEFWEGSTIFPDEIELYPASNAEET